MTTRDVIFQLTAKVNPSTRGVVGNFATILQSPQADLVANAQSATDSVIAELKKQTTAAAQGASDIDSLRAQLSVVEADRHQQALAKFAEMEAQKVKIATDSAAAIEAAVSKFETDTGGPIPEVERDKIIIGVHQKMADEIAKIDEDLTKAKAKEAERQRKVVESSIKAQIKDAEKAATEKKKALDKSSRDAEAAADKDAKARAKDEEKKQKQAEATQKANAKAAEKAETDRKRAAEKSLKDSEVAADKLKKANRETLQTLAELGEGVLKVGRGFVAMGLIGERDLAKVQDTLLGMQAAFDLVGGSIQTYLKISKIIESLRTATLAAAAAQEIQTAAQARNVVVTNAQAAAQGRLAVAQGAGAVGGVGAGIVGGAGAAGAGAAGAGAGAGIGLAGALGGAAAIGSLVVAIVGLKDVIAGGGRFKEGSLSYSAAATASSYGGYFDTALGLDTDHSRAYKSGKDTERMARKAEAHRENEARRDRAISSEASVLGKALGSTASQKDSKLSAQLEGLKVEERSKRITEEISAEEENIARLKAYANSMDEKFAAVREEATAAAEEGEKRLISLLDKKRAAEQAAGAERLKAAQESLRITEQEAQVARSKADEAKASLLSAEERFGLMDQGEQERVKQNVKRLKAGESLSPDELRGLQGLGLGTVNESVGAEARRRAQEAGFNEISGDDQKRLTALDKAAKDLEVQVSDKRQVVVNVDRDTEKIVKEITSQVLTKVQAGDAELLAKVNTAMSEIGKLRGIQQNGGGRG